MWEIKIPVNNEVGFVIGDVKVDVDIRFMSKMPIRPVEEMAIASLNNQLGAMGFEIEQKVKEIIEKHLSGGK